MDPNLAGMALPCGPYVDAMFQKLDDVDLCHVDVAVPHGCHTGAQC